MITGDLLRVVTEITDVVSRMDDLEPACELACERLQDALRGPVAILERSGARWRLRSGTSAGSNGPDSAATEVDDGVAAACVDSATLARRAAAVDWGWIPLGGSDERVMLVPATWQRSEAAGALEQVARQLGYALEAVAQRTRARHPARVVRAAYRFSRRIAAINQQPRLHQFIAEETARAARANLGALALYSAANGHLRIAATVGYPRLLVDHVRVLPGEGILGGVFSSGRPLLVSDVASLPNLGRRRARYRTPSFMAVPILAAEQPLGVICVTDRVDGQPFDARDLLVTRALSASASLALSADAISRQAEVLSEWATIDPLTQLFNRRYFRQRLEEEFQRARRYDVELSVLLLDIDDFKAINDRFGHVSGDAVLRAVADVIRQSVRAFDVCCRYGGEEFAVLLPGGDRPNAMATAHRVREAIEAHRLTVRPGEPAVGVTVSIGSITLRRGDSLDNLIADADAALYEAKRSGKNQIRVAPTSH